MSRPEEEDALAGAVAAWIRAEYYFRAGKRAYRGPEAEAYEQATLALRKAATGKRDLVRAARRVGIQTPDKNMGGMLARAERKSRKP